MEKHSSRFRPQTNNSAKFISRKLMFTKMLKSIFRFSFFLCVRFLLGVVAGYFWAIAVAFIFWVSILTSGLTDDWEILYECRERMWKPMFDLDMFELYEIGWELENGQFEIEMGEGPMAERVIIVSRVGRVGYLWVFPALGLLWGLSQIGTPRRNRGSP